MKHRTVGWVGGASDTQDIQKQYNRRTQINELVAELMAELANVRPGWEWSAAHAFADELNQAADMLIWLYESQSNCRESVPLFGQAVRRLQGESQPARDPTISGSERRLALAQALSYQRFFCYRQGQHPHGRNLLNRSRALLQPLGGSPSGRAAFQLQRVPRQGYVY